MNARRDNPMVFILNICMISSLYILIYLLFFGLMAINNPQILTLSRTSAITLLIFTLLLISMGAIYGGPNIAKKKRWSIVSATILSVFFTDIISYVVLQIMNVNAANNEHIILFGNDFPILIFCIVLQTIWIYTLTLVCHRIYFLLVPPSTCCIICDNQTNAEHVASKISTFNEVYKLTDILHYSCDDLNETILKNDIVFITGINELVLNKIKMFCYENNKNIYIEPDIHKLILSTATKDIIDDAPFLNIPNQGLSLHQRIIKRAMDVILSFSGLLFLSPIMLLSSILILVFDNGPVFFMQERLTKDGKPFNIIKFRTMKYNIDMERGESVSMQENDDRITLPGRFLRKTRIDELPQLFNILRGDMSIVGPRPEMLINVVKYTEDIPEFKYRQKVKCGLTGLAQIDGKYNTSAHDKLLMDLFYIENYSILLDVKLIFRTLSVFFKSNSTEGFKSTYIDVPTMRKESLKKIKAN